MSESTQAASGRLSWRGFLLLTTLLLSLAVLAGCAQSQVRYRQERVSRDYTYIDFTQDTRPLTFVSEVGGEHMSYYKVLAFEGDRFRVTVTDLEGKTSSVITGDGVEIREGTSMNGFQRIVEVQELETLFSIELDAHPYARYRLGIEKI
ncbi:hypothetical protein [uncultured Pseudodesulfovibrio sp.]|uniref:hypothetical protein n=1 Tax=uncultured Pseudodesulfovibrio sp. TaxID=2035858 RepID=UPI0029C6613C|nr:hypothetical protein [uncultured Pseudodesulfovibrio sp.]